MGDNVRVRRGGWGQAAMKIVIVIPRRQILGVGQLKSFH